MRRAFLYAIVVTRVVYQYPLVPRAGRQGVYRLSAIRLSVVYGSASLVYVRAIGRVFILYVNDFFVSLVYELVGNPRVSRTIRRRNSFRLLRLLFFVSGFFYVLSRYTTFHAMFFLSLVRFFRSRFYRKVVVVRSVFVGNGILRYFYVIYLGYLSLRASRFMRARVRSHDYLFF